MITKISDFKINESLSSDRAREAKLQILIDTARQMIENYKKAEEFEQLKNEKNIEVKEVLERLNKTSVIAEGVLIEVIKPFQQKRFSSKAYFDFVETSVGTISEDFRLLSNEIKATSIKMSAEKEYIRTNKNTRNKETGTMSEGIGDFYNNIKNWVQAFVSKLSVLLNKTERDLGIIMAKAEKFSSMVESAKDDVIFLKTQLQKAYEAGGENMEYDEMYGYNQTVSFEDWFKKEYNPTFNVNEDLSPEEERRLRRNRASRDSHARRREQNKNVETVLVKAKEAIELAQKQSYFEELAKVQEEQVIALLKEFNSKSIAIDDVILNLIRTESKPVLDTAEYEKNMTNAELVGDAVALMSKGLIEIHKNTVNISGSVRQYKDDSESPEGTFNARFDWENKTVKIPENAQNDKHNYMMLSRLKSDCEYFLGFGNGSERQLHQGNVEDQIKMMKELWNNLPVKPEWLTMDEINDYETKMLQMKNGMNEGIGDYVKSAWNSIKRFFLRFKMASKRFDTALENIVQIQNLNENENKLRLSFRKLKGSLYETIIDPDYYMEDSIEYKVVSEMMPNKDNLIYAYTTNTENYSWVIVYDPISKNAYYDGMLFDKEGKSVNYTESYFTHSNVSNTDEAVSILKSKDPTIYV